MTFFDQGALLLTLVLAFLAIRSVVWFMLAGLVLLPAALDGILASHWAKPRSRLVNRLMVLPALGAGVWLAGSALAHPQRWYTRDFPPPASRAVARVTERHPGLRVFANERYADWLVLEDPGVAGRLAFDGRFELLTTEQLKRIVEFRARTEGAKSVLRGYGLYVLDPASERKVALELLRSPSRYVVYGDAHVIVIRQLPRTVTAA
jgi:hypothetical protein